MKIAITGSTGQLGKLVIEKLTTLTAASHLVALARDLEKVKSLGIEGRLFDYSKPDMLAKALIGIDKLLIVSSNEIGQRLAQHKNIIDAAKLAGVKHIVYTSLLHADTSSLSLAFEHLETEKILQASGITYTILRNGWYTENFLGSLSSIIANSKVFAASGEGKIAAATRQDYALAAAKVLTTSGHENKIYELAGDIAFNMQEFSDSISKVTNQKITFQNLTAENYKNQLIQFGLPEGLAEFLSQTDVEIEKGQLYSDSKDLSQLIERPTTSLEQAIIDAL